METPVLVFIRSCPNIIRTKTERALESDGSPLAKQKAKSFAGPKGIKMAPFGYLLEDWRVWVFEINGESAHIFQSALMEVNSQSGV